MRPCAVISQSQSLAWRWRRNGTTMKLRPSGIALCLVQCHTTLHPVPPDLSLQVCQIVVVDVMPVPNSKDL